MSHLDVHKTEDGNNWHIIAAVSDEEANVGGSLTGVHLFVSNYSPFSSGAIDIGSYTPGQNEYTYDAYYGYFAEGDTIYLFATNGEAVNNLANTTALPFAPVGPPAPSLPSSWSYANYAPPVPSGDNVAGFYVDGGDNNLLKIVLHWTRYEGAGHYRLEFRPESAYTYYPLVVVDQTGETNQTYTINPWQDDARILPGVNQVWRIRAES